MRKNTCILIRNWRKLPQNTNRRICRSRQYLQTQEMNIKVTNIISDIPSCCASLGECGSSLILEHGIPHPPKIYILTPQAPGRHSLETGPTPTEACGFPGAGLTARCHHSHPESSWGSPPLMAGTKQWCWVPQRQQHQALLLKKIN